MSFKLSELNVGFVLPDRSREVTQEHINLYAEASHDYNPIHLDPEFAKKTGLDGTIAHGMLILAYLSTYMTDYFGVEWLTGASLNTRFKAPARPGDIINISGKITGTDKKEEFTTVICDILCQNQNHEPVIVGETKVRVKNK